MCIITHPAAPIETYYEPADCGRELGVTSATVRRLTERGLLTPVARTIRGTRLYRKEEVLRVAERRRDRGYRHTLPSTHSAKAGR
jgi:hypothetical protein